MHEQEQAIFSNQTIEPKITKFAAVLREKMPTKAVLLTSATTALTLTGCSSKEAEEAINYICCVSSAATFIGIFIASKVSIPGEVNKAIVKLTLQNKIDTGAISPDDEDLTDYARRFHHKDVHLSIAEIENYQPGFIMRILLHLSESKS